MSITDALELMSISVGPKILFGLPLSIAASVLTDWLYIRSIGSLDSACCNRITRPSFISLCQQKEVSFFKSIEIGMNSFLDPLFLDWAALRKISLVSLAYSQDVDIEYFTLFLSTGGERLRSISIHSGADTLLSSAEVVAVASQVALKCAQLTLIQFCKCRFLPCVSDIFTANPALTTVQLQYCIASDHFPVSCSPHGSLQYLHIADCELTPSCANSLGMLAQRIEKLYLNDISTDPTVSRILLKHLVNLRRLFLIGVLILDSDLADIVTACPCISLLLVSDCKLLTDVSLILAVERLPLEWLDVGYIPCTDALLHAIEVSCPTLHTLLVGYCEALTVDAIARVLRNSLNISTISVGWSGASPAAFSTVVAPALSKITTLVLVSDLKCAEMLLAVANYCTCLERLDVSDYGISCSLSAGLGLVAVLKQCVHLRLLTMTADDIELHFSGTARLFLSCFRPDVTLSDNIYFLRLAV